MKKVIVALLVAVFVSSALAGCNTFRGMGRDIEQGGQAIQDAAS